MGERRRNSTNNAHRPGEAHNQHGTAGAVIPCREVVAALGVGRRGISEANTLTRVCFRRFPCGFLVGPIGSARLAFVLFRRHSARAGMYFPPLEPRFGALPVFRGPRKPRALLLPSPFFTYVCSRMKDHGGNRGSACLQSTARHPTRAVLRRNRTETGEPV